MASITASTRFGGHAPTLLASGDLIALGGGGGAEDRRHPGQAAAAPPSSECFQPPAALWAAAGYPSPPPRPSPDHLRVASAISWCPQSACGRAAAGGSLLRSPMRFRRLCVIAASTCFRTAAPCRAPWTNARASSGGRPFDRVARHQRRYDSWALLYRSPPTALVQPAVVRPDELVVERPVRLFEGDEGGPFKTRGRRRRALFLVVRVRTCASCSASSTSIASPAGRARWPRKLVPPVPIERCDTVQLVHRVALGHVSAWLEDVARVLSLWLGLEMELISVTTSQRTPGARRFSSCLRAPRHPGHRGPLHRRCQVRRLSETCVVHGRMRPKYCA